MSLQAGTRFGRYELAELLGKGGMGEVYRAHDTVLHRPVALKILSTASETVGSKQSRTDGAARMLREARAAAGIVHPNAIAIYDVGELDGVPFLAMELVSGATLRAYIGDASIPLPRRIRWLTDIARALGAAHELGLVHRDIKPENVMVRDDGVVKVLDFGIARRSVVGAGDPSAATAAATFGTLTADGVVVGTPMYMAPEQMRGESIDGRADQFAWGVVAHELLSGAVPWQAGTGVQLVAAILSSDVAPLRQKNPEIPPAIDAAVRVALNKSPRDRYTRMDDLADEIEPFAAASGGTTARSRKRSIPASAPNSSDAALAPTEHVSANSGRPVPVSGMRNEVSTRTQLATAGARPSAAPPARSRVGIVVASLLALAAVVVVVFAVRVIPGGRGSTPAPDANASRGAESQMSASSEATGEYRAGMRALRDGTVAPARSHLDNAVKLDPGFAAAHLGRAMFETVSDGTSITSLQKHLAGARAGRSSLGERDRALLDALEPCAFVPPDFKQSAQRLAEAAAKYPDDADFPFEQGFFLRQLGDHAGAVTAFQSSLARDPTFATALRMIAHERIALDDVAGAVDADEQCVKTSPGGIACLADLALLRSHEGKCDEVVSVGKRMLSLMPESDDAYFILAGGLAGVGEPLGAVRSALELRWQRVPADHRRAFEAEDGASLDVLAGDFTSARAHAAELDAALASDPEEWSHFRSTYLKMLLDFEVGRMSDVIATGRAYLERRSAWADSSFDGGLEAWVTSLEFAAGGISPGDFEALRARWLSRAPNAGSDTTPGATWAVAYAGPVQTPADAALALGAMPSQRPLLDARKMTPDMAQRIGHAYLLGGKVEEAIPLLREAVRTCNPVRRFEPFFVTWAALDLGQALEARGDPAGACTAYGGVLERWGGAPSSRTAARARARARALRCDPGASGSTPVTR